MGETSIDWKEMKKQLSSNIDILQYQRNANFENGLFEVIEHDRLFELESNGLVYSAIMAYAMNPINEAGSYRLTNSTRKREILEHFLFSRFITEF